MVEKKPKRYGETFETDRRLRPQFWNPDYCLLSGMANEMRHFVEKNVTSDLVVLDYGCGAKPYRSLFPEECNYIGVDTCINHHADLVISPGEKVPLPNNMFDCIISTQVVYLIPNYENYLIEAKRLLKSNGLLFITSHGTWTHHPASGGDYYRFTKDGMQHILEAAGFQIESMRPIVGTLGTGLHLRQLVFNNWLKQIPFIGNGMANIYNILINARIYIEDKLTPLGTRMSSPVIFACVARIEEE